MPRCEICGREQDVLHTCKRCGRKVCDFCFVPELGLCIICAKNQKKSKKEQKKEEQRRELFIPEPAKPIKVTPDMIKK